MKSLGYLIGLSLALVLLVGLRVPFLRCEPFVPGMPLQFDEKDYLRGAKALAAGDPSADTNEAWMRAPGTAWLLLTTARLRGVPVELAACDYQRLQVGMWGALLLLASEIARQLFGRRAAVATAFLVAVLPTAAAVTLMVHADTPFMLAFVAAVAALLAFARRGGIGWLIAAGLLAGLAGLVRSPILPLLPLLALWAGWEHWRRARRAPGEAGDRRPVESVLASLRPWRRSLPRIVLPAALLLACAAAVLAPWTVRNYRLYGGFIPSDTTGAATLLDNNAPPGYPSYRAMRESSPNPAERQRFASQQALAFMRADPLRIARKVAYASWLAWSPETFRRTWNFWAALLERTRPAALLAQLTVLYWPAIAIAVLGMLFAPRANPGAAGYRATMIAVALYYTLMTGLTHFEDRYRLPYLLLWLPFAGWCLAHPRLLLSRLWRPAGLVAVAAVAGLAISYLPLVWPLERDSAVALALHARGLWRERAGDPAGALADQQAAAATLPDMRESATAAGQLEGRLGDLAGAERTLRAALASAQAAKLRPPADTIVALQEVLRAAGRPDESAALDGQLAIPARRRAEQLAWASATPGAELHLGTADFGLVRGFYTLGAGQDFRLSAPSARLLLAGPGDNLCLYLNAARPPGVPAPTVTLAARIGDAAAQPIGSLRPPRSGWAWLCAPLPDRTATAPVEVELRADRYTPFEHGEPDARDLGVAVQVAALRAGPLPVDTQTGLLLDLPATAEPGAAVRLLGASGTASGKPGDTLALTLWWLGAEPPAGSFTFLHLLGAGDQKIAEYNAPLAGGARPSPWSDGEPLLDHAAIPLPSDLAPGRYRLVGGAFDPSSGAELARAELGAILVEAK